MTTDDYIIDQAEQVTRLKKQVEKLRGALIISGHRWRDLAVVIRDTRSSIDAGYCDASAVQCFEALLLNEETLPQGSGAFTEGPDGIFTADNPDMIGLKSVTGRLQAIDRGRYKGERGFWHPTTGKWVPVPTAQSERT